MARTTFAASPTPLFMDGFPGPPPGLPRSTHKGSASKLRPLRLRLHGDRGRLRILTEPSSGDRPRSKVEPSNVARSFPRPAHAFQLARTLMVPVTLFQVDGEFGVMLSDELDDADVVVIHEYDPHQYGPAH